MDDESSSGRTTPAQNDHSGTTQLTLLIGRAWRHIGRGRRVRDCALQSPLVTISAGEFVFFDQLVQVTSEENGVVQPDVPVWLLMVGCSQAAALDLNQKQCPQVGGEGVTGPGL